MMLATDTAIVFFLLSPPLFVQSVNYRNESTHPKRDTYHKCFPRHLSKRKSIIVSESNLHKTLKSLR